MGLKKFSYLLLVLAVGCSSLDYDSYEGKKIELNYLHKDDFVKGDWVEIDGVKFTHLENMNNITGNDNAIPTSTVIKDSLGPDKKFRADYNSISIAIMLANKLKKEVTKDSDSNGNLLIVNQPLLMTKGKLTVMKNDSSTFKVKTSQKYPARIEVIEI